MFVSLVALAAWCDLRTRRIPNWLTLSALVCALVLRASHGLVPLSHGVAGAGVAFAVGVLLFSIGALGGGDTKLLTAIGAFLGHQAILPALLLIAVFGGMLGVIVAVRRGVVLPSLLHATGMIRRWVTFGRAGERRQLDTPGAVTVPYGIAIALGALVWWFREGPFI